MSVEREDRHPERAALRAFVRGELRRHKAARVVRHLLRGCTRCREILAAAERDNGSASYELSLRRALGRAVGLSRELDGARLQAAEVLAAHAAGRSLPECAGSSLVQWLIVEHCLRRMEQLRSTDPEAALALAALAQEHAEAIEPGRLSAEQVADLQARAQMEHGNCRRAVDQVSVADRLLGSVPEVLARGTGDPRLIARYFDLLGSLYRDQRRYPEAARALDLAASLYRQAGDRHMAGRVRAKNGLCLWQAGEPEAALAVFVAAVPLLDGRREPHLLLGLVHNALLAAIDAGWTKEAATILWAVRGAYKRLGGALDRVRLLGVEAKLAMAQGQPERAEQLFRQERAGFERAGLVFDASVVALELAALLADEGRHAEVATIARDVIGIFKSGGLRDEAMAAVLILYHAARRGSATAALARAAIEALKARGAEG